MTRTPGLGAGGWGLVGLSPLAARGEGWAGESGVCRGGQQGGCQPGGDTPPLLNFTSVLNRLTSSQPLNSCSHTHVHTHQHTYTHTQTHVGTHAHVHTCTHRHEHTHTNMRIHTQAHMPTYARPCTHAHTCAYVCVHMHTHAVQAPGRHGQSPHLRSPGSLLCPPAGTESHLQPLSLAVQRKGGSTPCPLQPGLRTCPHHCGHAQPPPARKLSEPRGLPSADPLPLAVGRQ